MFIIRPGIYNIPVLNKRIDTRTKLSNSQMLELCLCKQFPFIEITEAALPFLKKQKLKTEQVASLIMQAKTAEQVNLLLEVKKTKPLPAVAETKIKALENS